MMIVWLTGAILALDQVTKYLVRANLAIGETLPVIPDVFHITYVQNRGAAFSMFQNMPMLTVIVPMLLVGLCIAVLLQLRREKERVLTVLFTMVMAGGIGNLIDRVIRGYVTDMLDFRVFPVFNVADIAITLGCIGAAGYILLSSKGRE